MTNQRKHYQTVSLNFEYHYFSGTRPMDEFLAAIEIPRKLARWAVNMLPNATSPYLVITRDESEEERDRRLGVT